MTLRTRTLAIVTAGLGLIVAIPFGISRNAVPGGFEKAGRDLFAGFDKVEEATARVNVERVLDALAGKVATIEKRSADWAQWDDTYRFVLDHNPAYATSNLIDTGLSALDLNVIALVDLAGRPAYATGFDLNRGTRVAVPEDLRGRLVPGSPLLATPSTRASTRGLLLLRGGPLIFVSRPIVHSDGSGPPRGTLFFGRFLDGDELKSLSEVTHLPVQLFRADGRPTAPFDELKIGADREPPILVRAHDEETISGYAAVADFEGNPALFLKIDMARAIHRQALQTHHSILGRGRTLLVTLLTSMVCAGFFVGLGLLALMEWSVLRRVVRLSLQARQVGSQKDFSARLPAGGTDEIGSLSQSFNGVLDALAASHSAFVARDAELHLLLATVPTGLLSLDENFRINPEFSRAATRMLGEPDLQGHDFAEILGYGGHHSNIGRSLKEFLAMFRSGLVPEEHLEQFNPIKEVFLQDRGPPRWLGIRYALIRRGEDQPSHILCELSDITEAKWLAETMVHSEQENVRLKVIAEDPELFRDLLDELAEILREARALVGRLAASGQSRTLVGELFRGVHTVKGVAGSFGMPVLADLASRFESRLESLRQAEEVSENEARELAAALRGLDEAHARIVEETGQLFGEDIDEEGVRYLRVPCDALRGHYEAIRAMATEDADRNPAAARLRDAVLQRLTSLYTVPAQRGLARSARLVPALLERLGKEAEFRFSGQKTPIDYEVARELNTPLLHLLRNAVDHGLEPPEERLAAGKPPQGEVTLDVSLREDAALVVVVADDGRGLNGEVLRRAAVHKGLLTQEQAQQLTPDEALDLILQPGFSTAERVTDISGRGVGLDTALASVTKLHGTLGVASSAGHGTRFTITVPPRNGTEG